MKLSRTFDLTNFMYYRPGGSLLLVGRSGVGRRTATTLTAYMQRMRVFSPSIVRDFDAARFSADLKEVMAVSGVEGGVLNGWNGGFFVERNVCVVFLCTQIFPEYFGLYSVVSLVIREASCCCHMRE